MHQINTRLHIALYLAFFIVAVLLSSMGVVVMGMVNDVGITKTDASILESFKDITIILSAFLVSSFIPRLGYKKTLLVALSVMGLGCFIMPTLNGFWAAKIMFVMTGLSFMLLKVVIYSLIGLHATNDKEYTSSVGILEGFFSFSMLIGTSLFGMFILLKELGYGGFLSQGWTNAYWLLTCLCVISFALVTSCTIDESTIKPSKDIKPLSDVQGMWVLLTKPSVIAFALCVIAYGFLEQAITTWLPKLYNDVFALSESTAVFLAGSWPLSIAIGRLGWGIVMRYIDWMKILIIGLFIALAMLISISMMMPISVTVIGIPLGALLLPWMGLFIGAVYPTLSASMLGALKKSQHSPMTGWSIIFYAMGGAIGSRILGMYYQSHSGVQAIEMLAYPLGFLIAAILAFAYYRKNRLSG
ncbi:MAG: MFS transporter [Gammaproteobacteria bacterium]